MFSRFKNFVYRHRRKLVVAGVLVSGTVLVFNYVQRKFIEWQEREAKEFFKKAKKEQHFRTTERTCNQTIYSLSKTLKESIFSILDSDIILQRIREGNGNRVSLWEELKIVVFAQICALLYCGMMLVILLRIQLNIIGGYMIKETEPSGISSSSQEKYLSLCQHFLEDGIRDICNLMKKHSELILKDVSLKNKMTLKDIEDVFWRLESSLDQDPMNPIKNLSTYLIPPINGNAGESQFFNSIITDTVDLLGHEEVLSTSDSCLKRAFSNVVDKIAEYYAPVEATSINGVNNGCVVRTPNVLNVSSVTVPLAKLVPVLHSLYRGSVHNGSPDPWIEQYILMEPINRLGADLYESYSFEASV